MRWRVKCRRCGRDVRVPLDAKQHWHRCDPPRRRLSIVDLERGVGLTEDERRAAAWAWIGGGS